MKQKLNQIKLLLFSFIAIVFFSCEKDLYEDAISNNKTIIREVQFNELYKEQKFKNLLEKVSNNKTASKNFFEDNDDFILSDQNVKVIETDSITSYTILIKRKNIKDKSYFENLVIQKNISNNVSVFIIKYIPDEIRTDVPHNSFSFTGNIIKSKYQLKSSNKSLFSRDAQSGCYMEVLMCFESEAGNRPGHHHTAGKSCQNNQYLYLKTVEVLCSDGGSSGGSYTPPSSGSPSSPPSSPGGGSPGDNPDPGYIPPGDDQNPQPDPIQPDPTQPGLVDADGNTITSPVMPIPSALNTFEENLSTDRVNWWRDNNNVDKVNSIKNYLNDNTIHGNINQEASIFAENLIDLMIQDPTITWDNIVNWFLIPTDGQDDEYDAAFWENPNLTFPQQSLPTRTAFVDGIPKFADGRLMTGADNVYGLVGGKVLKARLDDDSDGKKVTANTCALKISIALNRSGVVIPYIPGETLEGEGEFAGKYFFLNAKKLNMWMRKTFGTNPATATTPYNANHMLLTAADGGIKGANFPKLPELQNVSGIYSLVLVKDSNQASGHADYIFTNADGFVKCAAGCNFNLQIERMDIWILN